MQVMTMNAARKIAKNAINEITDDEIIGPRWTTAHDLTTDFIVVGVFAPFVQVVRRSDGVPGTLLFRDEPRVYYGFKPYGARQ